MTEREKVIKRLEEISDYFFSVYHRSKNREEINKAKDRCDAVEDAIALMKEQEASKGHWIPVKSPTGVEAFGVKEMTVQSVRCSACNAEEDVSFSVYKFCPRCGAKMERAVK